MKTAIFAVKDGCKMSFGRSACSAMLRVGAFVWLVFISLACVIPASAQSAQSSQPTTLPRAATSAPAAQAAPSPAAAPLPAQPLLGSICGTVVDQTGAAFPGAQVTLAHMDPPMRQVALTDADGQFAFARVSSGPFEITVASPGFATKLFSATLRSGETYTVPQIMLAVETAVTEVHVGLTPMEVAEDQLHDQEKQRVLGVLPNFYVSYVPDAVPLSSKQKFELAWKTTSDPISIGITGAIAGIEQSQDVYAGYGQGAQGFGKRFGASYADLAVGTFVGSALLPALLKQDPRYFYKGSGSKRSRLLYAIANSVICKGDNGHWQANYSSVLGSLAAGGISNLYYPASDRNGAELTFQNAAIALAATAGVNVLQEFVIRRVTHNLPPPDPAKP